MMQKPKAPPPSYNWCFTVNTYTDEDILQVKALQYKYLVFGYEIGEKCGTLHLQCYVELSNKCRRGGIMNVVPRAAKVNPRFATASSASNYCKKGEQTKEEWDLLHELGPNWGKNVKFFEDGILSDDRMLAGVSHTKLSQRRETSAKALKAKSVKEALSIIKEELPYEFLIHGQSIKMNLSMALKTTYEHKYKIEEFNMEKQDISKSLLLYGPSGMGKTHFALAHFKNPLLVRHMDRLREFDSEVNDGIVFDDLSFSHYPPEAVIHLLDMELDSEIHIRYTTANIPQQTPKIFTHNTTNPFYKSEVPEPQQQAIERRLKRVHIYKSLVEDTYYPMFNPNEHPQSFEYVSPTIVDTSTDSEYYRSV